MIEPERIPGDWYPLGTGLRRGAYWSAIVARWTGQDFNAARYECRHAHRSIPAADECAEREARRRNRPGAIT